jgi:hypothetical protein
MAQLWQLCLMIVWGPFSTLQLQDSLTLWDTKIKGVWDLCLWWSPNHGFWASKFQVPGMAEPVMLETIRFWVTGWLPSETFRNHIGFWDSQLLRQRAHESSVPCPMSHGPGKRLEHELVRNSGGVSGESQHLITLAQVHPSLHSADVQELFKEQTLRTAETSRAYPRSGQRYRSCHWDSTSLFSLAPDHFLPMVIGLWISGYCMTSH